MTNTTFLRSEIVKAGEPWARRLREGELLKITDLHGQQAVDFLCFDAQETSDRYNAGNTIKMCGNIYLGSGSVLWSDRGKRLMEIVEDSCGGHDTIAGCCSREMNQVRYQQDGPGNCRDTFERALAQFDLSRSDIVSNVNWFMCVPVRSDGSIEIADSASKPGDYVVLKALRDVLCVISNCTQIFNASNGFSPTPVKVETS